MVSLFVFDDEPPEVSDALVGRLVDQLLIRREDAPLPFGVATKRREHAGVRFWVWYRVHERTLASAPAAATAIWSFLVLVRYATTTAIATRKIRLVVVVPSPSPPSAFGWER